MRTGLLVVTIALAILVLDRLLLAAERRGWIYYRRSRGHSGTTASAFLEIQSMMEPSRKHVIEARQKTEEDDDSSEPPEASPSGRLARFALGRTPMDQMLQQYTTPVEGGGSTFRARAIAVAREDGMWEGYFEFDPVDGGTPLRTERETTQPSRDALVYWATGIEPTYLAGALERAMRNRGTA